MIKCKCGPRMPECMQPETCRGMLRDWMIGFRALCMWVSMTGECGGRMVANLGQYNNE